MRTKLVFNDKLLFIGLHPGFCLAKKMQNLDKFNQTEFAKTDVQCQDGQSSRSFEWTENLLFLKSSWKTWPKGKPGSNPINEI